MYLHKHIQTYARKYLRTYVINQRTEKIDPPRRERRQKEQLKKRGTSKKRAEEERDMKKLLKKINQGHGFC